MSEDNEITFDGGFFEEAGVDVSNIADDPFGFGNGYWPIFVVEVGPVKVTNGRDKVGMMVTFAVDHPDYEGTQVAKSLGFGNWFQIPVPKAIQGEIPWDPTSKQAKEALFKLKQLFKGLGFAADEMGSVNGEKMKNRHCMAKIGVRQNDRGFWEFNPYNFKPMGSVEGTESKSQNSGSTKTAEELLKEELEGA